MPPPFTLEFVKASSRLGWRWKAIPRFGDSDDISSCEINWLDEEPDSCSIEHLTYEKEVKSLQRSVRFYRGIHNLPSREEYHGMCIAHEESEQRSRLEYFRHLDSMLETL